MTKTIFVFGSNLAGRHGKGAALEAKKNWGAVQGVGEGITGDAYAIPTKSYDLCVLPLHTIEGKVNTFLEYARANPNTEFFVTKIGTGLAGYKDYEIAPMFKDAPINCFMHPDWIEIINNL